MQARSGTRRAALLAGLAGALTGLPGAARCAPSPGAAARPVLRIEFMVASGVQRSAWVALIERFKASHPELELRSREFGQEDYKRGFEQRLDAGQADLVFWFAGERLRQAVAEGRIEPLRSPELLQAMQSRLTPATLGASRIDGQTYAFPLKYYHWGFFYRKSLFARLGLQPPQRWSEFELLCEQLLAAGVKPTAVGAREGWPAAAWFDYLNLRINGLEVHRRLMRGDMPWSDPAVERVLLAWQGLLRKGYFLNRSSGGDWDAPLPYLYRGEVGMLLLGAFAIAKFPAELRQDIGFFPFPRSALPAVEEAPLDVLLIPAGAPGRAQAERFLQFLALDPALNSFTEALGELSPRLDAPPSHLPWLAQGKQLLDAAPAITFFFDRDAHRDLVEPAFRSFEQLLRPPHALPLAPPPSRRAP